MAPLAFVDKIGLLDIKGGVDGGGASSQAGAVRHALSLALAALEDETTQEHMRQGGYIN